MSSVHSLAPWNSSGSFGCLWSIPVHPRGIGVHAGSFGCVPSIPERNGVCRVSWGTFRRTNGGVGLDRVPSGAPWGSSGSFWSVRSISLFHGGRRVRSGAFS